MESQTYRTKWRRFSRRSRFRREGGGGGGHTRLDVEHERVFPDRESGTIDVHSRLLLLAHPSHPQLKVRILHTDYLRRDAGEVDIQGKERRIHGGPVSLIRHLVILPRVLVLPFDCSRRFVQERRFVYVCRGTHRKTTVPPATMVYEYCSIVRIVPTPTSL